MTLTRHVDVQKFQAKSMGERSWGLELLVGATEHYTLKCLYMKAGTAGGLQKHRKKDELFHVVEGRCWIDHDIGDGKITRTLVMSGESYHIPPGAVHRVEAITDCFLIEASNPIYEDRIRCEAEYGEPEVGGLPTTEPA